MTEIIKPFIAGNWKLHHAPAATTRFFADFLPRIETTRPGTLAFFPPSISLAAARAAVSERAGILLGVQNVYWEEKGAFTGEISAPLAREAGAQLALVGHSERRHVFGETNGETARKVEAVLAAGLHAVLCVGETLDQREAGRAAAVVEEQLSAALEGLETPRMTAISIAYEPVWAIGTGRTATPADASEMHAFIRRFLRDDLGSAADDMAILYGGSVKPDNARELLTAPEIDGVLVGGASLEPDSFASIWSARP